MSRGILIIGATSAMAKAAARTWAARGERLVLAGRDGARLESLAADLRVRGAAACDYLLLDANDSARHGDVLEAAAQTLVQFDVVLIAHGALPDQRACEGDAALVREAFETNALSVMALATWVANRMEAKRSGTLAVIGSVAGDRGRQSNYVYGAAKAAVDVFLAGLRNRLQRVGVHVLTIKPGFVDTPMTAGFAKGPLWASAERAGAAIVAAIDRRADVAYVPGFWRWIMLAVRLIPERVFKKMRL